jgi:hypothetical protein
VDGDLDTVAIAGEVLVDGIVEDLEDAMVEAAFIRGADVHAGALADAGEAFELVDFRGVVEIEGDVWEGGKVIFALLGFFGLFGHRIWVKREAINVYGKGLCHKPLRRLNLLSPRSRKGGGILTQRRRGAGKKRVF